MKLYDPKKKYKVECRAIMRKDVEVYGNEVERVKKEWDKKFEGRKDFQPYYLINEVKDNGKSRNNN